MAMGTDYVFTTGKQSLAASSTKTLLLLKPAASRGFTLIGLDISFDSGSAEAGVQVDLYRTTSTTAPGAGTAVTGQPMHENTTGAALTAGSLNPASEPSLNVLASWFVQPLGGLLPLQLPLGREFGAAVSGQYLGVRITTPASVTPDCVVNAYVEE